jgi:hypothetical protein
VTPKKARDVDPGEVEAAAALSIAMSRMASRRAH